MEGHLKTTFLRNFMEPAAGTSSGRAGHHLSAEKGTTPTRTKTIPFSSATPATSIGRPPSCSG